MDPWPSDTWSFRVWGEKSVSEDRAKFGKTRGIRVTFTWKDVEVRGRGIVSGTLARRIFFSFSLFKKFFFLQKKQLRYGQEKTQSTIPSFRVDSVPHSNDGLLTFSCCVPGVYIIRFSPLPGRELGENLGMKWLQCVFDPAWLSSPSLLRHVYKEEARIWSGQPTNQPFILFFFLPASFDFQNVTLREKKIVA